MNSFFGLYIHWPFCVSKCPYCDFNSHVQASIDTHVWKESYLIELDRLYHQIGDRELRTIYFGGGTPSLMPPDITQAIIEKASQLWSTQADIEITLEANPNSAEIDRLVAFKTAGVNRVSIGIQSLVEEDLRFLKRAHSREEGIRAIETAARLFQRYSFDLIYARPQQTLKSWKGELSLALSLAQDHLSLYQLTIEPHTAFYTQFHRGDFILPDEDLSTDLYLATQDQLAQIGMYGYEISNFARPGSESRHNLIYWQYDDYAGIGPGAHGRLTLQGQKYALHHYRAPQTWLEHVKANGGTQEITSIEFMDQIKEALMMGLRLEQGIDLNRFQEKFQTSLESLWLPQALSPLFQENLLEKKGDHLRCTPEGRLRLNGILHHLFRMISSF